MTAKLKLTLAVIAAFTIAVGIFSLLLPVPAVMEGRSGLYHFRLIWSLLIPAIMIVSASLFVQGLEGFKKELYRPYRLIAIGLVLFGLSLLQSPMITFLDLWNDWPMTWGLATPPYILAIVIIYTGLGNLQRILGIKTKWHQFSLWATPIALFLIVIQWSPHAPTASSEAAFDTANILFSLTPLLAFVTAGNALAVSKNTAPAYAKVLRWLSVGLITQGLLIFASVFFYLFGFNPRSSANLQDPLVITTLPFLRAGYLFYKLTADVRNRQKGQHASIADVVIFTASLASNKATADSILDDLRVITARHQQGQALDNQDKADLGDTYLKLENYLTTLEAQRSFTRASLRDLLYDKFYIDENDRPFWSKLPRISRPTNPLLR